ncbi:MAG: hypothetical protein ABWZ52_14345 [Acidimicrobiales bacterium]
MKRMLTATIVGALALVGSVSTAGAANQPGQGEHSTVRNDAGFGGGPHCHILVANDAAPFTIRVFPSHTGHMHAGNDIFNADADCDGAL